MKIGTVNNQMMLFSLVLLQFDYLDFYHLLDPLWSQKFIALQFYENRRNE